MNNTPSNITCSVEFITPEMAEKYLAFNNSNRSISQNKVKQYAKDMETGNWMVNGETICFFENGELKDGQHRLSAIVLSGKGQWTVVVRGISHDAFIHNRGKLRTVSNVLEIAGYPSGRRNNATIGAINLMYSVVQQGNRTRLTDAEIKNFVDKYGDYLETAYSFTMQGSTNPPMKKSPAIAAVFCALYNGMAVDRVEEFCKIVNSGFCDSEQKFTAVIARNAVTVPIPNHETGRINLFRVILAALHDFNHGVARKRAYTVLRQSEWEAKALNECFQK